LLQQQNDKQVLKKTKSIIHQNLSHIVLSRNKKVVFTYSHTHTPLYCRMIKWHDVEMYLQRHFAHHEKHQHNASHSFHKHQMLYQHCSLQCYCKHDRMHRPGLVLILYSLICLFL